MDAAERRDVERGRESARVAVLMSTWGRDRPDRLRSAIDSILTQRYQDLDLFLLVDGPVGSETLAMVDAIGDRRLRVIRQDVNRGLAFAMNRLIDLALEEPYAYFARMDADDVSMPDRLLKQIAFMEANRTVDVLGTSCEEVDEHGRFLTVKKMWSGDAELKRGLLTRCPFVHSSVVFRRRVFEAGARYHTDNYLTEDMFLWAELAHRGCVFDNLAEPLLRFCVSSDFYRRRRGLAKAVSEFRARRSIARATDVKGTRRWLVPLAVLVLRVLPEHVLKLCYRYLRPGT